MDKMLKAEIIGTVRTAVREAMETYKEVWLTGDDLCKQFGMFTPSWLKRYGHKLPRTQAVVTDADGVQHVTGWAYPRNKIQRLISENRLKIM